MDAYRNLAIEIFVVVVLFKNLVSFGISIIVYDWLIQQGVRGMFITLGNYSDMYFAFLSNH